jgi:hypothetical protein
MCNFALSSRKDHVVEKFTGLGKTEFQGSIPKKENY